MFVTVFEIASDFCCHQLRLFVCKTGNFRDKVLGYFIFQINHLLTLPGNKNFTIFIDSIAENWFVEFATLELLRSCDGPQIAE